MRAGRQRRQGHHDVPGCGPVVVNAGQTGYYRTLYAPAQFAEMRSGFAKLAAVDQLGVLQDTWALGIAGQQPSPDYLKLAAATPVEADPQVWGEIAVRSPASTRTTMARGAPGEVPHVRDRETGAGVRPHPLERTGGRARTVAILRSELIETLGLLGERR